MVSKTFIPSLKLFYIQKVDGFFVMYPKLGCELIIVYKIIYPTAINKDYVRYLNFTKSIKFSTSI